MTPRNTFTTTPYFFEGVNLDGQQQPDIHIPELAQRPRKVEVQREKIRELRETLKTERHQFREIIEELKNSLEMCKKESDEHYAEAIEKQTEIDVLKSELDVL